MEVVNNRNIYKYEHFVDRIQRENIKGQQGMSIFMTGLSGSGKSTIANQLEKKLNLAGYHTYILDGDNVRLGLNKDLGFSEQDRKENIRRITEVSKLFVDAGIIVIASFISPFKEDRDLARETLGKDFNEVYINADIEECERRDPKGIYKKVRLGEIKNFTGIDSPYEEPENPEIELNTIEYSANSCTDKLYNYIINKYEQYNNTETIKQEFRSVLDSYMNRPLNDNVVAEIIFKLDDIFKLYNVNIRYKVEIENSDLVFIGLDPIDQLVLNYLSK